MPAEDFGPTTLLSGSRHRQESARMSASIKHLILTRFNVPSPGREQHLRSQPGWLADRFRLFRDYCLPGVAQQTEQDFDWVIFFDEQTPAEFKAVIRELQQVYPFKAEFTDRYMMPEIIPGILPRYTGFDWLLTTRLDSDDILAVDHVARLREAATAGTSQVFNFPNGVILSTSGAAPRVYRIVDRKNPFASLLEPMSLEARTIWSEIHVKIGRLAPIRQIEGRPAWLQVVHGGNVSNRIKGTRVRLESMADLFPIVRTLPAGRESDLGIAAENYLYTPWRQARGLGRYVVARLKGL
jgi:hypothetical protein